MPKLRVGAASRCQVGATCGGGEWSAGREASLATRKERVREWRRMGKGEERVRVGRVRVRASHWALSRPGREGGS